MPNNEQYRNLLEEMLDLAGVLNEADDEDDAKKKDPDDSPEDDSDNEDAVDSDEEDDEPDEELADKWAVQISTGSKLEIEFHDTFVYVYYRNRRSSKISIPQKLRKNIGDVSSFMNAILSHVEKVS